MDFTFSAEELLGEVPLSSEKETKKEGVAVKHKNKDIFKKLLPENYEILGKINMLVEKGLDGKPKTLSKTMKEASRLSGNEKTFLMNLRNLLSYDGTNPYDKIIKIEPIPKEALKLNSKEDYKAIAIHSKKEDLFARNQTYVGIMIYKSTDEQQMNLEDLTTGKEWFNNKK